MKGKRKLILILVVFAGLLTLMTCDHPLVNPEAENYQGYTTVATVDEVTADHPAEGGTLTWCEFRASDVAEGAADLYAIQIDESGGDFSVPMYEELDSASNLFHPDLTEGSYLYRVKARSTGGEWPEGWSETVSFTADSGVDETGLDPSDGGSTTDTTPALDWPDITGAASYQVEFATSEAALDGSGLWTVTDSGYQIPNAFALGETCYWWVRGVNADGVAGVWSGVFYVDIREPEIGDAFEGGIVFYIDGSGGGLVCAESDQSTNIEWGGYGTTVGGTSTAIGTGAANMVAIVDALGTRTYAARLCYDLELNGYNDWFLPSKDELYLMHENLYLQGFSDFQTEAYHWSSSESDSYRAWGLFITSGHQSDGCKNVNTGNVRAVRAFSY